MDPILVEVMRGDRVESRHSGAVAVSDADGKLVFAVGDTGQAIYPRSAIKALLALPLVESGAADRLGLTDAELALACSSHNGEAIHTDTAASMLARAGRDVSALECGTHWPSWDAAARTLAISGAHPTALHNNCSGKHAGFICLACDAGHDPTGYVLPDHPTMRAVTAPLAEMTGTVLDERNRATDGCSIPTYAIPLRALAQAFARFAGGQGVSADRAAAIVRLRHAVAAHPMMVAGHQRFDTELMMALGARVFAKGGAEGVHCVALPALGLGIAVKCDDGAHRATEIATAAVLSRLMPDDALTPFVTRALTNWNGIDVGEVRAAESLR